MTRVLCVTSWFPPHHFGGYERSCHDVMVRLAERGHHVEVLTGDHRHPGVEDGAAMPLAAVHRDLQLYFRDGELWSPPVLTRVRVERHNQRALRAALDSCRPDVVAVWHVGALSLGLLATAIDAGLPVVLAVSDDWPAYAPNLDPWTRAGRNHPAVTRMLATAARLTVRLPDLDETTAAFISDVTRQRCQRSSPWRFPRSTIVHSGIDLDRFTPSPHPATVSDEESPPRSHDPGSAGPQLLYVGRVDERKGIRTLLHALPALPGAELVIDGQLDDRARAQLDAWCEEAGLDGRVVVQTSGPGELAGVYRAADVCVFPSEWEEPFGLVPLEAMACGTPVVASGAGGSAEFLVDGGNCVLFDVGDPASLAAAVDRVISDAGLRDHLARQGALTAAHFGADQLADAFESLYEAAARGDAAVLAPRHLPELDVWTGAGR